MFRWFIARRYLFSRIITFAALVVVAASVSLLIVIVSVLEGFRSELQSRIRGTSSDLKVESSNFIGLRDPDRVSEAVERVPGVHATAPYVETVVFYRSERGIFGPSDVEHRLLRVLDLERELKVGDLERYVHAVDIFPQLSRDPRVLFSRDWVARLWRLQKDSRLRSNEPELPDTPPLPVLVGQEAFSRRGLFPGSTIYLNAYSPRTQAPTGERPFLVTGYFKTGIYELDSMTILMERSAARDFLGLVLDDGTEVASGVRIDVQPAFKEDSALPALQASIRAALDSVKVPFVRVMTWREEKAMLLGAVRVEKGIMSVILGVIILFGGLMMFIILTLLVVEKTRDLGVLQSLGATPGSIASIFFRIGVALCTAGSILGVAHGVGFASIVNLIQRWVKVLTGYEVFPPSVYYIDKIPVQFQTLDLLSIIVPTVVVSLLASAIPAVRASRKDPVVALRYE
jgi:lipoprotein-releasing system permease protein